MKYEIDVENQTICTDGRKIDLYSEEGFYELSSLWLKVGWNQKYTYTFSWFGVPIIQLPDDMLRYQEVVFDLQPDIIIETGIAHGGSAVFSASLCKLLGKGKVVAVDIDIRPHNRDRISKHPLSQYITMIQGSSVDPSVVEQVSGLIGEGDSVLVVLDSNHSYEHVYKELLAYSPLVSKGSYIISTDGYMRELTDVPRGRESWSKDNPAQAAIDFVKNNKNYIIEEPRWQFNESNLDRNITHWPEAWIKRIN